MLNCFSGAERKWAIEYPTPGSPSQHASLLNQRPVSLSASKLSWCHTWSKGELFISSSEPQQGKIYIEKI